MNIRQLHEQGFLDATKTVIAVLCDNGWTMDEAQALLASAVNAAVDEAIAAKRLTPRRKWTAAERDRFRTMYLAGEGADVICATLGLTKNQFIGAVSRDGLRRPRKVAA